MNEEQNYVDSSHSNSSCKLHKQLTAPLNDELSLLF